MAKQAARVACPAGWHPVAEEPARVTETETETEEQIWLKPILGTAHPPWT